MLRELIRTPESNTYPVNINHVFSHLALEDLLECVITRAAPPCTPVVIALRLNLLGIKSINACSRAAKDVRTFTKLYQRRLNTLIHLDVGPASFAPFRNAMDRTFALASQTSTRLNVPDRGCGADRVTRPVSLIHRDVHARNAKPSNGMGSGRSIKSSSKTSRSPRVRREAHYSTAPASQSSIVTPSEGESPPKYHTDVCTKRKPKRIQSYK